MRTFCFILCIWSGLSAFGQQKYDTWIEARGKYGFLAAHRSIMGHLPTDHASALEVSYLIQSKGSKAWHTAYKNPVYGVTAYFGTAGNNELLGHYFGLYGFMNFPFISREHYVLSGKLGAGLAYTNKKYDPETNILGMAVSTSVNAEICLAIENRFRFGNHSLTVNLDMTHFSNGATKVPNLGLNLPFLSLGYGYRIHKAADSSYVHAAYKKSWHIGLMAFSSVKEIYPSGGHKFYVGGLSLVGRRYFRPKTAMELSVDMMYNSSIMDIHADVPRRKDEIIQVGVFAGYVLPLDRFHFLLGMGVYARDKFVQEELFYHRLGMRYVFPKGITLSLLLKSHWARADYVEYGIGYTFKR